MKKTHRIILFVVVVIVMMASSVLAAQAKKIDINSATLEELQTLPGIGPKLAQTIIDGRPYQKVDDLLNIKGITKKKLTEIQKQIEVRKKKKVNINNATLDELQTLPGIGPKIAQAIIDGRPYQKADDLLKVKGLGEKKCAQIRDLISVKISINTATVDELKLLPGIGPEMAQVIVKNRPYKKIKDLLNVKGLGKSKFEKIKDLIEL